MKLPSENEIIDAAKRIAPYTHRTPLLSSESINNIFSSTIFFKCENFQKAGAFKSRGACNAVFSLTQRELSKGVGTHSSGNHAQALARAASLRKIPAYIVMPETTPWVKVEAVKSYGGNITFCKPTLEARESNLKKIIDKYGAKEIHPYNNYTIITGQATCGMEIFEKQKNIDIIIAPVGGGGLLSGTAISTKLFSPKTKIIAAEPHGADDAYRSFREGKLYPSKNPDTIADGLLTSLGSITWPVIKSLVDDIVRVEEDAIIRAMKLIWERMKIIIEPSSAVPLAALLEEKIDVKNKNVAIILSGGNIDLGKLPW